MKHFFAKYKKKILQIGIVFAVIICLAVAIYFIFDYLDYYLNYFIITYNS